LAAGRFITLEGGEGSGKSTQAALLADRLRGRSIETVVTREPGGSPGAEAIRRLLLSGDADRWEPLAEALLHFAARQDHLRRLIRPALARGAWVVCDRFADSTVAYQGYGLGVDADVLGRLADIVVGDTRPDLTVVLDIEPETGLARAAGRREEATRYERMDAVYHQRVRAGFLAIARAHPDRCAVVEAAPDPDRVAEAVWETVRDRLAPP
jgi:dTMP kinase